METELRKAMSMLPRLDYTDPVAARSEMKRFVRLSTLLGSQRLTLLIGSALPMARPPSAFGCTFPGT
jgi:hypothetical protein